MHRRSTMNCSSGAKMGSAAPQRCGRPANPIVCGRPNWPLASLMFRESTKWILPHRIGTAPGIGRPLRKLWLPFFDAEAAVCVLADPVPFIDGKHAVVGEDGEHRESDALVRGQYPVVRKCLYLSVVEARILYLFHNVCCLGQASACRIVCSRLQNGLPAANCRKNRLQQIAGRIACRGLPVD